MKNLNKYFHFIFCSVLILLLIFLLNILIGNFIPENKRINKIKENTCLIISNEILNEFFMFDSDTLKIQAISDRIYYTNLSLNNNRQILIDNILKDINIDKNIYTERIIDIILNKYVYSINYIDKLHIKLIYSIIITSFLILLICIIIFYYFNFNKCVND